MSKDSGETTLVDYFVVAGYDPEIGLVIDPNAQESSLDLMNSHSSVASSSFVSPETLRTPLQRAYVAKINCRFPQRRLNSPFREEILSLCMPKSLRFYTEKDVPCEPSYHTFANILEDGTRINGTAITFYEEVRDYTIKERMTQLHTQHVRELTAMTSREAGVDHRERAHLPPGTVSGGTHTLPRGRKSATKRISYYGGTGENSTLYMSRTLCLITRLPIVCSTTTVLRVLHHLITSSQQPSSLPLESYIYWFLNEIPMPSPGTTLKVPFLDQCLIIQRPGPNELPFFDDIMSAIFEFMSVEKFVKLLSCFLLENQILVCSKHLHRLMLVCETLCTLAFPFRWQLVYVPILPFAQLKFVEAPVPYVMGWCYEEAVPESIYQSNVCVIDLDIGRAEFPEGMPVFPDFKKLCLEIRNIIDRYSNAYVTAGNGTNMNYGNGMEESTMTMTSDDPNSRVSIVNRNLVVKPRSDEWNSKRMSRSFDLDDGIAAIDALLKQANGDFEDARTNKQVMKQNEGVVKSSDAVARAAEIARRMGVEVNIDHLEKEIEQCDSETARKYFQEAKINNAIRECILHKLVEIFYSYEHFVVGANECKDRETFEANRESMACFDKASFLSDQPDSHLTFLSHFLETQMFTSFIDAKILSQWEPQPDEYVKLFDDRIEIMRRKLSHHMGTSIVRTPTCESAPAPVTFESESFICKRETMADYVVPAPHPIDGAVPIRCDGNWPMHLNTMLLEGNNFASPAPSPWKQRYPRLRPKSHANESAAGRPTSTYGGPTAMPSDPQAIALQQYNFVQQLLRETKTKTKRMLVDKMGKEAVQLGHLDAGITGVEENTLVASFCDLLERIWAHGLKNKQGKSALWSFVLQHQELEKPAGLTTRASSTTMLSPGQHLPPIVPYHQGRAPSLPPQDLSLQDPTVVPDPIILSPNENDFATALSDLVETIQKELSLAAKDVVTAAREVGREIKNTASEGEQTQEATTQQQPAWSQSIMKAANFISSKISTGTDKVAPPPTERLPQKPPQHPVRRYGGALSATNILSGTSRDPNRGAEMDRDRERDRERRPPRGFPPKMQPYPSTASTSQTNQQQQHQQHQRQQQQQQPQQEERGRTLNRAISGLGQTILKKSSSIADFTNPNWSMGSSSGNAGGGNGSVTNSPRHRSQSRGRARSPDGARVVLGPLPTALAYDLKNVLRMTEIKTDIGYARAFVRLALERKLLHKHLQTLFGNQRLISYVQSSLKYFDKI
ncbi:hypothetical protein WR25_15827 isoform B [Diploscapter pachys]|uniref:UDENN domain-containing protein n=1 Tax=Diploscapter pachys TaxID=2018661 RepID=A0A2A2JQS4_9BILA|nr:hypothetical protein WR25_15827 isoform B [Diploscapter pachys]